MKACRLNIIFSLLWQFAIGQEFPNLQFNFLTSKEGLSNNEVSHITQDKEGFIWISTGDGLNRFDGYRVKHFFRDLADQNSLINNSVYKVFPDSLDHLWISTVEGLSVFDKHTGSFHNFRHNPADNSSLDNDQFTDVYTNKQGSTWISTLSSVYSIDNQFHIRKISTGIQNLKDGESKTVNSYERIIEDKQGRLWAIHYDHIFLIDKSTMHVLKSFGPIKGSIRTLYQDADSNFWIGSFYGGLMRFDPESGKTYSIQLPEGTSIVHSITDWYDPHHKRWLAMAADNSFVLLDPLTLQSKIYTFHQGYFAQPVIPMRMVQYVFVDKQNILWIATDAGVCYAVPSRQLYDLWPISKGGEAIPTTISDWIFSLCETTGGYWTVRWMGTSLNFFDHHGHLTNLIDSIQYKGKKLPLVDSLKPCCISHEGDSILWFTTEMFLVRTDLKTKKAILYKPVDGSNLTGLRTILPVNDHTWWIRTRNNGANGIYVFDPIKRKFTGHFINAPGIQGSVPPQLFCIFQSFKKDLYATSRNQGLYKYDLQSSQFLPWFSFENKDLQQHSNNFESLAEDSSGLLWIGTYSGVIAINPINHALVCDYTHDKTIGGIEISGVTLDQKQNIWLSTSRGIYYILSSNGQVKEAIPAEGGMDNSYGIFQEGNGRSILCGIKGYLLHFIPEDLLQVKVQHSSVNFSEATVMDAPRYFDYSDAGLKELKLKPGENRFSIDFAVLNYDGTNHYYYKLEGAMNEWQQNENGHLPFYNVAPGTYTLLVKGGTSSSPENIEDRILIVVQPHWWQTNLSKFLVISFIALLTAFLVRRRIVQIRKTAANKQRLAEVEMMALRSQMNPHFIFNSLTSIENFMMQNEKRLASTYLNKFARLIRAILDSSRNEMVPLSHEIETLKLYVDLEQLRFNHKFAFTTEIDSRLLEEDIYVPALLLQPYIENAIIHGLAPSTSVGLKVDLRIFLKDDFIYFQIRDNGIGRKMSAHYNSRNRPNHRSVGLLISEERIQIFNTRQGAEGGVTITDLYDTDGNASGTAVEIRIKSTKYHALSPSHIS